MKIKDNKGSKMGQNYKLNSSFGLNVTSKDSKVNQVKIKDTQLFENILNKFTNYVEENENVFNGTIENEINMYTRQSMFVGMNLKAGNEKHRFDTNV